MCTHGEILAAAEKKGLKPCPPWVGPQYRLDYDDKETLFGMEPVSDGVFRVLHSKWDDSRWLENYHAGSEDLNRYDWIFVVSG